MRRASPLSDTSKLHLILAIHNHQPVGNFDHVLEDAYKRAYLPFLELLQKHPSLKVVLHYSGNLLSWMEEKHPEAISILRGFVKARRVEFLTGGFYEPILSALPDEDRVMQVKELTEYIHRLFHCTPAGMWVAERVWEPRMPAYLSSAGIEYVPLDDYHFMLSGLDEADLSGYFLTEENGSSVLVFPGSERLRYYIPFRGVDEILSYFREVYAGGGSPLLTLADDGEKFGVWPETHRHCYEDGWLEKFFSALEENSGWVETTTFSEYRSAFRPRGMVYLPTASYREMGEWVLPPDKGREYEQVLDGMEKMFGERAKGLLRGGIWRSFLSKYPEANHLHKRMLMVSEKVHEAARKLKRQGARGAGHGKTSKAELHTRKTMLHELWKGQCNDAYWHGIFGGLYLPHLRSSLYRHLIAAETMAEDILCSGAKVNAKERTVWKAGGDLDCDGFRDICIGTADLTAFFTERGGSLVELSLKRRQINILDTLTRRNEAYHSRLSEATPGSGETRTIHERLTVKEEGLSEYLVYDPYTRASLLDRFFPAAAGLDSVAGPEYRETGDFISGIYDMKVFNRGGVVQVRLSREGTASGHALRVEKTVKIEGPRLGVDYMLKGSYSGIFGTEFNISLLGSPYASLRVNNKDGLIKDRGAHEGVREFSVRDRHLNLGFTFSFDEEMTLWHYPVETVSLSEEGVERIYQGTAFYFVKRLDFSGRKRLGFNIDFWEVK
jgi:alpha-amylase